MATPAFVGERRGEVLDVDEAAGRAFVREEGLGVREAGGETGRGWELLVGEERAGGKGVRLALWDGAVGAAAGGRGEGLAAWAVWGAAGWCGEFELERLLLRGGVSRRWGLLGAGEKCLPAKGLDESWLRDWTPLG